MGATTRWLAAFLVATLAWTARAAAPLDAGDFEPFFAGALGGLMAERHVPGAVVLVVRDGAVVFAQGYGVADLETGRAVDPETTLFRVASVSKLFTATAVMQLVEQGKLDLDADVNGYLKDVQVPATFPTPITLRQLLTHTPGLDDGFLNGSESLDSEPMPLGAYLARFLPPRVRPPGTLLSYSNHGIALAGLVVEQVSGQPFREYVREHILLPLGMTQSGFSLPSPPPPELAVGYDWKNDRYRAASLDRLRMAPAGDLYTSAGEIARFMLAHLAAGRVPGSDARILREDTARAMHAQAFTHHPELVGWCLGFDERSVNGVRAIGHGGSWNGFGTELVLVPEAKLGLFVSTTRNNDPRFFRPLLQAFFDRYFPPEEPRAAPAAAPGASARTREAAGAYIPNRHVRRDFLKLGLLRGSLRVSAHDDGSLTVATSGGGFDPIHAVAIADGIWQSDRDDTRVAFLPAQDGDAAHLVIDSWSFDRVSWWRDPELHKLLLGACAFVFAATLLVCGVGAALRALTRQPASSVPAATLWLAVGAAGLSLAVVLAVGIGLTTVSPFDLFVAVPLWLRAAGFLPFLSIPLSLAVLFFLLRNGSRWTPLARLSIATLVAALAVFAALAWSYNLIGMA